LNFQKFSGVEMSEQWAQALTEIKKQIGVQNFETWIAPIHFVSRNKNEVVLEVPNKFFRDCPTPGAPGKRNPNRC
jgi:hypothetical protein